MTHLLRDFFWVVLEWDKCTTFCCSLNTENTYFKVLSSASPPLKKNADESICEINFDV